MNLFKVFHESPNKQERIMGFPKQKWLATDGDYDSIREDAAALVGQKIYRVHEEGEILYVKGNADRKPGREDEPGAAGTGSNDDDEPGRTDSQGAGNKNGGRNKQNKRNK